MPETIPTPGGQQRGGRRVRAGGGGWRIRDKIGAVTQPQDRTFDDRRARHRLGSGGAPRRAHPHRHPPAQSLYADPGRHADARGPRAPARAPALRDRRPARGRDQRGGDHPPPAPAPRPGAPARHPAGGAGGECVWLHPPVPLPAGSARPQPELPGLGPGLPHRAPGRHPHQRGGGRLHPRDRSTHRCPAPGEPAPGARGLGFLRVDARPGPRLRDPGDPGRGAAPRLPAGDGGGALHPGPGL
jgi:hypothetical protein